jgi:hypothetical protein
MTRDYEIVDTEKAKVPLQAWSGPEGSRKLRFPDYMTTAQDGGKVVSLTPVKVPGQCFSDLTFYPPLDLFISCVI